MATLKDIADRAGVSISTVSRILNQDDRFNASDETRKKIIQIAQDFEYKKNSLTLLNEELLKRKFICILLYDEMIEITDPYYLLIRTGIKDECERQNACVEFTFDTRHNVETYDGVIVVGSHSKWSSAEGIAERLVNKALVFVDFNPGVKGADSVVPNFKMMVETALNHFTKLGYHAIGYLGGVEYDSAHKMINDKRYSHFENYMKHEKLFNPKYIFTDDGNSMQVGYKLMRSAIENNLLPRALFVETDTMAIGVIKALNEYNIKIPQEVAIVSCNDIPTARYLQPALTSIRINSDTIGKLSVSTLVERIKNNRAVDINILVDNALKVRNTCGEEEWLDERINKND